MAFLELSNQNESGKMTFNDAAGGLFGFFKKNTVYICAALNATIYINAFISFHQSKLWGLIFCITAGIVTDLAMVIPLVSFCDNFLINPRERWTTVSIINLVCFFVMFAIAMYFQFLYYLGNAIYSFVIPTATIIFAWIRAHTFYEESKEFNAILSDQPKAKPVEVVKPKRVDCPWGCGKKIKPGQQAKDDHKNHCLALIVDGNANNQEAWDGI